MPSAAEQLATRPAFIEQVKAETPMAHLKKVYTEVSAGTVARAYHIAKEMIAEMHKDIDPLLADVGTAQPIDDYQSPAWAIPAEAPLDEPMPEDPYADDEPTGTLNDANATRYDVPVETFDEWQASRQEPALTGELLPAEGTALFDVETIIDMTPDEARTATNQVRQGKEITRFLLLQIKNRKGYTALGYKDMGEYLAAEFDGEDRKTFHNWITHAAVQLRISGTKMGKVSPFEIENLPNLTPITQQQALVLAKLPVEIQERTYKEAKKVAETTVYKGEASRHNGKLTTALLTEIVADKLKVHTETPQKALPVTEAKQLDIFAPEVVTASESAPAGQEEALAPPAQTFARYLPANTSVQGDFLVLETTFQDDFGDDIAIIVNIDDLRELLKEATP